MTRIWNILLVVGCVVSIAVTTFVVSVKPAGTSVQTDQIEPTVLPSLPPLSTISSPQPEGSGIARRLQLKTNIPDRPSNKIVQYRVQGGDSPSSIARQFNLQPESILWANENLNANAGSLKPGMVLNILPVNGVLHTVNEGDTLEAIGAMHKAQVQEIFEFPGNDFDLTQSPRLERGQGVIVPNGISPILWSEAQMPGAGQGGAGEPYSSNVPALGTGSFIWPINSRNLTQEFWSGHPGIDVSTNFRQPVFAADSGTVISSGWDNTGYGYFVVIDHGNGFKTTYGHNEANLVSAGQTVVMGQQIAESGNSGNSTGNHLDFRILYNGAFVNPLGYLP
jgi:murein DD-endopeptidase MepM/ murein hydrolase activator NlpD